MNINFFRKKVIKNILKDENRKQEIESFLEIEEIFISKKDLMILKKNGEYRLEGIIEMGIDEWEYIHQDNSQYIETEEFENSVSIGRNFIPYWEEYTPEEEFWCE